MMHVAGHGRIFELIAMNRFSLNVNVTLASEFFVFGRKQSHCNLSRCRMLQAST